MSRPKSFRVPLTSLRMVRERTLSIPYQCLSDSRDAAAVARSLIGKHAVETVIAIMLDSRGNVSSVVTVSVGGMNSTACTPRDILRAVLTSHAAAFVLAHNHPSGDPSPSKEDLAFTRALVQATKAIGLPLLDHVIVTSTEAFASVPLDD